MLFASSAALLFLALDGVVLSVNGLIIHNADELISFSSNVNSGTNYFGTTVYLGSDIEFNSSLSQQFQPIGKTDTKYFNGTFDGQGHVIRNLTITTPSYSSYTGLFGYSGGATIRNLVMDASCSVVSSSASSTSSTYAGGIISKCEGKDSECLIANSVNMGSVSFGGNVRCSTLYLGGIAGVTKYTTGNSVTIRNCVNYGAIVKTGTSGSTWMGGIVGSASGDGYKYIQNCANYGPITHSGSTETWLGLGGIVGYIKFAKVENCLSAGNISSTNYPTSNNYRGAVVGYVRSNTCIEYCHFTDDVGLSSLYGPGSYGTPNTTGSSSSPVTLDSTLLNNLNTQTSKNSTWNKWLLNTNKDRVTFKVNDSKGFSLTSQLILLPDLAATGSNAFKGWFTDTTYSTTLTSQTISEGMTLYGLYGVVVTVTFDGNGGTSPQETKSVLDRGEYGTLPTPTRTGYTFAGWFTASSGGTEIVSSTKVTIAGSQNLYAHWTINNYAITFIFNNGTENEVRIFDYNSPVVYPENITKEGYIFNGWDKTITTMPAENITVTAQWIESTLESGSSLNSHSSSKTISPSESDGSSRGMSSPKSDVSSVSKKFSESSSSSEPSTEFVVIVFEEKDLKEEDVKNFIKGYVNETSFVIVKIENDETGGTRALIKFADVETAKKFIEIIGTLSGIRSKVKRVDFFFESTGSFSEAFYLSLLSFAFIF